MRSLKNRTLNWLTHFVPSYSNVIFPMEPKQRSKAINGLINRTFPQQQKHQNPLQREMYYLNQPRQKNSNYNNIFSHLKQTNKIKEKLRDRNNESRAKLHMWPSYAHLSTTCDGMYSNQSERTLLSQSVGKQDKRRDRERKPTLMRFTQRRGKRREKVIQKKKDYN